MQQYQDSVTHSNGAGVAGASIRVLTSNGAQATIYSDNGVTVAANPIKAGANGQFSFYAADGNYTLVIDAVGHVTRTVTGIVLQDAGTGYSNLPDAGTITGAEITPLSRGAGALQSTLTKVAQWVIGTYQGFTQSGTGAVARTILAKLFDRPITPEDYGAVGDGVTDDYAALMAAFNALPSNGTLELGAKAYIYKTPIVWTGNKKFSIKGQGSRQSFLVYSGANAATDCFTVGDGVTSENGVRMRGLCFKSTTVMTAGAGCHFKNLTRSSFDDVLFNHQDGDTNFYHAAWFDGVDFVTVNNFQALCQQDGIRVNGNGPKADFFLDNGKIAGCAVGLHIGGNVGGVGIGTVDIINNGTNVLIDQGIVATPNRETFFAPTCAIDTGSVPRDAATYNGVGIDIQDTGGIIMLRGAWVATAGLLLRVGSSFNGVLEIDGGKFYNGFTNAGATPGDAIQIASTTGTYKITSPHFTNIQGSAINCTGATPPAALYVDNPIFDSNVVTRFGNVSPTSYTAVTLSNKRVIGTTAPIGSAVDGSPALTMPTGTNTGSAVFFPFYGANSSAGWLELGKSRGATIATHGLVTSGDSLGAFNVSGSDGAAFKTAARLRAIVDGTASSGIVPGKWIFSTANSSGTLTDRWVIGSDGNLVPITNNVSSIGSSSVNLANVSSTKFTVGSNQVVGARIAGYGTPTGNSQTANFPGATATLAQTSAQLAQLIVDLKTHGLLGV